MKENLIFVAVPAPSSMVRTPDLVQKTHLSNIPVLLESLRVLAFLGDSSSSERFLVLAALFLGSAVFACFALGILVGVGIKSI